MLTYINMYKIDFNVFNTFTNIYIFYVYQFIFIYYVSDVCVRYDLI